MQLQLIADRERKLTMEGEENMKLFPSPDDYGIYSDISKELTNPTFLRSTNTGLGKPRAPVKPSN
jgi:hypothetical protein